MTKINITEQEKALLTAYIRTSPLALVRYKAQAVLLASAGTVPDAIGLAVDRRPRTVVVWLQDWTARRMASIFSGHSDNHNASKLTTDQREQIKEVLSQTPSTYGLPGEFWDVPSLKEYLEVTFGVVYECDQSYHYLLKFGNLSFKYPDTFDRKRDEAFIAERMKAIRSELTPLLSDNNWEVFACDEVKMQQDAIIRRAWLKKGERTIVKVNRNKESQSYIGFLNQKNYQCHLYEMSWQNSDEVLKATEQFLKVYPDKKICIVWDNAPFHKSLKIREQLKTGGLLERVHLIAMPPYAPDNNPIEHVWNTAKQAAANIQHDSFEATKQAFSDFVTERLFRYSF